MKRMILLIFILLVVSLIFSGCYEPQPIRVCVDADATGNTAYSCESIMQSFLETIEAMGGPTDVILEIIPKSGSERETVIDRIRTEIMSGEGPDVFIVPCGDGYLSQEPTLFPVPEKTLETGIFLTLDEYIENAQFMDWDKQTAVIMEAGCNEYGQQILPLTYTLPLTFYRAFETDGIKPGIETTWQDMLEDETGVLTVAATWDHVGEGETYFLASEDNYIEYVLGNFANYKTEELLFTEEELLQRTMEVLELEKAYDAGEYDHVPTHYQTLMYTGFDYVPGGSFYYDSREGAGAKSYRGIGYDQAQTMIPIYSDDGGVTASVTSFAAINANTKRPEDAFYILDVLMDLGHQQHFDLYEKWLAGHSSGIPVHEDLMQKHCPIGSFFMVSANYNEYARVREQITYVRFRGGLAEGFDEMYAECKRADIAGEDYAPIVSEYYRKMEIMMAE